MQRLKAHRNFWFHIHVCLGLGFGFLMAITGLTGSVLVFWHELDQALNSSLYHTSITQGSLKTLDEIIAAGEIAAPPGWASINLELPQEASGNYLFGFYYPNIAASLYSLFSKCARITAIHNLGTLPGFESS